MEFHSFVFNLIHHFNIAPKLFYMCNCLIIRLYNVNCTFQDKRFNFKFDIDLVFLSFFFVLNLSYFFLNYAKVQQVNFGFKLPDGKKN